MLNHFDCTQCRQVQHASVEALTYVWRGSIVRVNLIPAMSYPFKEIEPKWQMVWEDEGTYNAQNPSDSDREKFFGLIEFPYPSGEGLHVGHPRSYTAIDILTRKKRMEGKNVLYPIGWDAFGLPAENYAIKTKQPPASITAKNIAHFTEQIKSLGVGFDWSREINTTDPAYYKWTQWMFIKFYESYFDEKLQKARPINELIVPKEVEDQGETAVRAYRDARRMAFKQKTEINWCPKDKIGLANEEAAGGICDRCGGPVEKREKEQWMLRITAYSQRLIDELEQVDYLDKIKSSQVNWIGRSEGALIRFGVARSSSQSSQPSSSDVGRETWDDVVEVFTTRPDTLFGATYMVLAPEHSLVAKWIEYGRVTNAKAIKDYQSEAKKKSDLERQENKEKTGVRLEGAMAINPATQKEIPIWIADYVLSGYGTGAIMAVPAHDERDHEFAEKFDLPIVQVIAPKFTDPAQPPKEGKKMKERKAIHAIIRRKSDGKFLMLNWLQDVWGAVKPRTFVIGGIEEGEDRIEAALREIKEETGYQDVEFVKELGVEVHTEYFAAHKDENRYSIITPLYFELNDEAKVEVAESEKAKHEVVWVDEDKVGDYINVVDGPFIWGWFKNGSSAFVEKDGRAINSDFLDGLDATKATEKMIGWLEKEGVGQKKVTYKLRDWVFSRQRYWGEPIPMINCPHCGWVAIDEAELPLLLPEVEAYEPTDTGESPLSTMKDWVKAKCPICQGPAKRETDTMPNWAGSSWYFLRYCDPKNDQVFASDEALKYWMPVDLYNGGMEHTTLHLLYSRFWYKVLYDLGHVPSSCGNEPYRMRRSHAMILGEGGIKMSKSRGNVVNPDDIVADFGADVFRTYEMFIGPYDMDAPWSTQGILGVRRFLDKVWNVAQAQIKNNESRITNNESGEADTLSLPGVDVEDVQPYDLLLNQTIKKVGEDIDGLHFNTAVSQLMILTNELQDKAMRSRDFRSYLKLIAPFAPHLADELWHQAGNDGSIHREAWPNYDETKLKSKSVTMAVQINGKVRGQITVQADEEEAVVRQSAENESNVKKYLEGKEIKKVVFVKNKIISFII